MYSTLKIERGDKQRLMDQWTVNFRAFDAPVMLLFFMDAGMQAGSYMDYGMFLQSVMLAALEEGLGVVKGEQVSLNADDSTSAHGDARLPKSRSGKLLRRTMRRIFNGEEYIVPSTMDDPRSLNEITA